MRLFLRFYHNLGLSGRTLIALTMCVYVLIFSRRTLLDITAQVQTLVKVCEGTVAMPPTFLFYALTWLAAFGQCRFVLLMGAAILVLTGFAAAKWWATRHILEDYFASPETHGAPREVNLTEQERLGWIALALAFVCSLPTPDWWLRGWYIIGQPSPNYWMNGTVLVSWPFAVMLFWESYRQLQQPKPGWWRRMLLWLVLLAVSKPGYAFVFTVTYPFFWLGKYGLRKETWSQLAVFLLFMILLAAEYYFIFQQPQSVYVREFNRGVASGVAVQPFHAWRLWSSDIPLSILAGVAFPLYVAAAFWQELRRKLLFWYAWAGFFAALCISMLLVQKGEEHYTWAFRFQNYIAAYLLFTVSAVFVWGKICAAAPRLSGRVKWSIVLFSLHLLSGLIYLGKMWWTRSHY